MHKSTRALRMAVIGVGVMGQRHAQVVANLPQTTLLAVADVNEETAERVASALNVTGYTDFDDLLANEELDAVTIATSDHYHKKPAIAALQKGLPILLEKPVAHTLAEAEAIRDAMLQARGKIMVGHTLRYDTRYILLAEAARTGEFGDIIHLYARRNATTWSGRRIGGRTSVTVFHGVHDFDAIRWITGAEVTRVYAAGASKALAGLNAVDTVFVTLQLSNGAVAVAELSWAIPYGVPAMLDARLDVVGTEGMGSINMPHQSAAFFTKGKFSQPDTVYSDPGLHVLKDTYERFLDYVYERGEPVVGVDDAIAALRIALAADESLQRGEPVDLNPFVS